MSLTPDEQRLRELAEKALQAHVRTATSSARSYLHAHANFVLAATETEVVKILDSLAAARERRRNWPKRQHERKE